MFVEVTPRNELSRAFKKMQHTTGLKHKDVEKTGRTIVSLLSKPYSSCRTKCTVCSTNPHVNCKQKNIVYQIKCQERTCAVIPET